MLLTPQPLDEFARETEAMLAGKPLPGTLPAGAFATQFGAVPYRHIHDDHGTLHEWLVKGLLTRGEQGMLVGASQAGKSFLALDISMAIARGVPWMGCKTKRGLVIYHAGESAKGVRDKRLPAYVKAAGLNREADLPFILLTKPLDLFNNDEDTNKLIAECKYWKGVYPDLQLELLTIDTFNAAAPGADENAGKDVGSIRRRLKRIEQELGCAVLIVHHKNAQGTKARGHSSLFADVENVLDVSLVMTGDEKTPGPALKDTRERKVRVAKVTKLKDGADEREFRFTLAGVVLGQDEDGDAITSCVIDVPDMGDLEPSDHAAKARGAARLAKHPYLLLQCVMEAARAHGRTPPNDVPAGRDVMVVEWRHVGELFRARWFDDKYSDEKQREKAFRDIVSKAGTDLDNRGYIKKHNNFVWRTNKRLPGERRHDEHTAAADTDERLPEAGEMSAADWLQQGDQE